MSPDPASVCTEQRETVVTWLVEETQELIAKAAKGEKERVNYPKTIEGGAWQLSIEVDTVQISLDCSAYVSSAKGPELTRQSLRYTSTPSEAKKSELQGRGWAGFLNEQQIRRIEGKKTISLAPVSAPSPADTFAGDHTDFGPFLLDAGLPEEQTTLHAIDNVPSSTSTDKTALSLASNSSNMANGRRTFRCIEIPDCSLPHLSVYASYSTLRSFLYFLHTNEISFAPSLAHFFADAAETSSDSKPTSAQSRRWLRSKERSSLPEVGNAHALYRLGDCYLHEELKRRAKNAILENITVNSVSRVIDTIITSQAPFELFSDLSHDYEDVRIPILDFVAANMVSMVVFGSVNDRLEATALQTLVRKTPGWKRIMKLIDAGEVQGGGTVLNKLLNGDE
ncbi:hypothetical protein BMF94_4724 [Rhodotorula taiwanensis]|uniref:BTB domain-containing protein n=1 Tax=Rhodotorula taiwanensis TaxID=741276 RepID=A0A2S5B612_9BASI|nr:hypothetical protein BMF94_4724 [Rhodotorula taiwanensis]